MRIAGDLRKYPVYAFAALVLFVTSVGAQDVREFRLSDPSAVMEISLVRIDQVRELSDGSVLMLDPLVGVVHIAGPDMRASSQVGRVGQGPREYSDPVRMLSLSAGRTLLVHTSGSRGLILGADGRPAEDWEMAGECQLARPLRGAVFSDDAGRMYSAAQPVRIDKNGRAHLANTSAVERWQVPCKRDTLTYVEDENALRVKGGIIVGGIPVGRPGTVRPPFQASAQWVAFSNGDIAVVKPQPFAIERRSAEGKRTSTRLENKQVAVSSGHKEQWRLDMQRPRAVAMMQGGVAQRSFAKPPPPREPDSWPKNLPPFLDDAVHAEPNGNVWIRRTTPSGAPPVHDVVGPNGNVLSRVFLGPNSRIVGLSSKNVYVIRVDEDEVEHLERYSIPF